MELTWRYCVVALVVTVTAASVKAAAFGKGTDPFDDFGRFSVWPGLEQHAALDRLDLQFCGTGSEAQVSRGPLGCGFPVVGDNPWLVALGFSSLKTDVPQLRGFRRTRGPQKRHYLCSGVLISDQFVVTSARCARGTGSLKLQSVRLGEYDFSSRRDCLWYDPNTCTEPEEVGIDGVAVHPNFMRKAGQANEYDLAVVRLSHSVTLRNGIRPICLPLFNKRAPSFRQFALTLGLHAGSQPSAGQRATECCECDRDRSTTHHVMDQERLAVFNTSYTGREPCHYQLLGSHQPGGDGARCLGSGTACVADLGGPLVAADRFGSTMYLEGVASVRPLQTRCRRPSAAHPPVVQFAPVRPHLRWLLDSVARLDAEASSRGLVNALADRFLSNRKRWALRREAHRSRQNLASTRIIFPSSTYAVRRRTNIRS